MYDDFELIEAVISFAGSESGLGESPRKRNDCDLPIDANVRLPDLKFLTKFSFHLSSSLRLFKRLSCLIPKSGLTDSRFGGSITNRCLNPRPFNSKSLLKSPTRIHALNSMSALSRHMVMPGPCGLCVACVG